jgi:deoxyadenosine/deoxycytidine kinase
MGKLISVVGNSGSGKTTLTCLLASQRRFVTALEQHEERPFQRLFSQDLRRYGLANQVDYLLYRAEQELAIRRSGSTGVQDGGLDVDFNVFTRHFFQKGYLSASEYDLCCRMYALLRQFLPPPDLIIRLAAPLEVIARRYLRRGRKLEIAQAADLGELEALLEGWISSIRTIPVVEVDASIDDPSYAHAFPQLMLRIDDLPAIKE